MPRWMVLCLLLIIFVPVDECRSGAIVWQALPVDSMAGRFGELQEGYRYRKLGYLTLISDGADVYSISMGRNLHLGRPNLPREYRYSESFNWTEARRSWRWSSDDGQADSLVVRESILAPGFLYETTSSQFRWSWEEKSKARGFILPLQGGARFFGEGEPY